MNNIGTRKQVIYGIAKQTSGGLTKQELKYNKYGKIISKRISTQSKKKYSTIKQQTNHKIQGGALFSIKQNTKLSCKSCGDKTFAFGVKSRECDWIGKEITCHKYRKLLLKIKKLEQGIGNDSDIDLQIQLHILNDNIDQIKIKNIFNLANENNALARSIIHGTFFLDIQNKCGLGPILYDLINGYSTTQSWIFKRMPVIRNYLYCLDLDKLYHLTIFIFKYGKRKWGVELIKTIYNILKIHGLILNLKLFVTENLIRIGDLSYITKLDILDIPDIPSIPSIPTVVCLNETNTIKTLSGNYNIYAYGVMYGYYIITSTTSKILFETILSELNIGNIGNILPPYISARLKENVIDLELLDRILNSVQDINSDISNYIIKQIYVILKLYGFILNETELKNYKEFKSIHIKDLCNNYKQPPPNINKSGKCFKLTEFIQDILKKNEMIISFFDLILSKVTILFTPDQRTALVKLFETDKKKEAYHMILNIIYEKIDPSNTSIYGVDNIFDKIKIVMKKLSNSDTKVVDIFKKEGNITRKSLASCLSLELSMLNKIKLNLTNIKSTIENLSIKNEDLLSRSVQDTLLEILTQLYGPDFKKIFNLGIIL